MSDWRASTYLVTRRAETGDHRIQVWILELDQDLQLLYHDILMFPSIEHIESYLESVEDVIYSSWSIAAPDLPDVRDTFNRLWDDVSRFGPVLGDIHVPSLGDFQVPPPPPPPPPPKSFLEQSVDWCSSNPWKVVGISTGAVGAGLLIGYALQKNKSARHRKAKSTAVSTERRQVVGSSIHPDQKVHSDRFVTQLFLEVTDLSLYL